MKVEFIIDEEYDLATARSMDFTKEQLEYAKSLYEICPEEIEKSRKKYQKSWNEINDNFSDYVKEKTNYDWFYPEYGCVVSTSVQGASNGGHEPKIVISIGQNLTGMRRNVAHELILSHFFEIYKRNYQNEGLTNRQGWAFAEIVAFVLTSTSEKTRDVETFWKEVSSYITEHSYDSIKGLQNELREVYLRNGSFKEFIKEGIKKVKKYPNMNPGGS